MCVRQLMQSTAGRDARTGGCKVRRRGGSSSLSRCRVLLLLLLASCRCTLCYTRTGALFYGGGRSTPRLPAARLCYGVRRSSIAGAAAMSCEGFDSPRSADCASGGPRTSLRLRVTSLSFCRVDLRDSCSLKAAAAPILSAVPSRRRECHLRYDNAIRGERSLANRRRSPLHRAKVTLSILPRYSSPTL